MRAITHDAVAAFYAGRPFKRSNTQVVVVPHLDGSHTTAMYLHGNIIAKRDSGGVFVRHAGWCNNTTKERLNGMLSHYDKHIRQHDFEWFLHCMDRGPTKASFMVLFDSVADENGWVRVDQ